MPKKAFFTAEKTFIPCFFNGTDKGHYRGEIIGSGYGSHTAACLTLCFRRAQALFGAVIGEGNAEILKEKKRLVPMSRQTANETADVSSFDSSALSGLADRNRILCNVIKFS